MDEFWERFFQSDSPEMAFRVILTLKLNKIEARLQESTRPPIFLKKYDEYGLVKRFSLNPIYKDLKIPNPATDEEEAAKIIERLLDEGIRKKLEVMLMIGQLEAEIAEQLPEEIYCNKAPLILKEVDGDGFPTTYQLNAIIQRG